MLPSQLIFVAKRRMRFKPRLLWFVERSQLAAYVGTGREPASFFLICFPLLEPICATMPDGSMRFLARVFADGPESSLKLTVPAGTKKLVIDPEQTLLTHP
jgi:hypothetical protein